MSPEEVKATRDSKGMTQLEFAHLVGVTDQTVSRWERGESPVSKTAIKLIEKL